MKKIITLLGCMAVITLCIVLGQHATAFAQTLSNNILTLRAGQNVTVRCSNGLLTASSNRAQTEFQIGCRSADGTATPTPTKTASATPVPSTHSGTTVGKCGESMDDWHGPVVNGCQTGHEHGDAPPDWLMTWLTQNNKHLFAGHFNTSPVENTAKHFVMKGFRATFNNQDVYFRIHAGSNAGDRNSRYHSYEVWVKDTSGNISHAQGWYNSGDPAYGGTGAGNGQGSRIARRRGEETSQRPVVLVTDKTSLDQGVNCEQWYGFTAAWSVDFGWTICNSTTEYKSNEIGLTGDALYNVSNWTPTGNLGNTRRLELAWYRANSAAPNRGNPPQNRKFWATQFGEIVATQDTEPTTNAKCLGTTTQFGVTYKNICLEQYVASTLQTIQFPGNAVQKTFPITGVVLPN